MNDFKLKKMIRKYIKPGVINYLKHNLLLIFFLLKDIIKFILGRKQLTKPSGLSNNKPKTIQFPITNNCNLRCKTCNVFNDNGNQITIEQVQKMIKDDFFSEIISVGINGGEPFLLSNIDDYIKIILELPRIKNISIISNGILKERITTKLESIYKKCREKGVKLRFTTSLDGYKDVHDSIRGMKGAFEKTTQTFKEIKTNKNKYCDSYGIICTISKFNIYYINDLIAYFKLNNIENYSFQLAVEHNRLHNQNIPNFSVMDENYTRMLAQEFFYTQFIETENNKYFFIYSFLKNNGKGKRKSTCNYMDRDITVDGFGNLAYCATVSKIIGHVDDDDYKSIFLAQSNLEYRNSIIKDSCDSCIHYTSDNGYLMSNFEARKTLKDRATWNCKYFKFWRSFK